MNNSICTEIDQINFNVETIDYGSSLYLDSAYILYFYATQPNLTKSHPVQFVLPCFVMLTSYLESYFNDVAKNIFELALNDDFKFDESRGNLVTKFLTIKSYLFNPNLANISYFLNNAKNYSIDPERPLDSDILIFEDLLRNVVKDRNALIHSRPKFITLNGQKQIPRLFESLPKFFNLTDLDIDEENIMTLKRFYSKIANIEKYFQLGLDFARQRKFQDYY